MGRSKGDFHDLRNYPSEPTLVGKESPILTGSSLFTVSRHDIHYYQICPKIVSIKTYQKTRYRREKPQLRETHELSPVMIGKVGEAVTEASFKGPILARMGIDPSSSLSPKRLEDLLHRELQAELHNLPKSLKDDLRSLVKESLEGLSEIRPQIEEALGDLTVIGRGESRYGALLATGLPDYVAFVDSEKPILIEVKNTSSENRSQDTRQASFYNTLANTVGVVLQDIGFNGDEPRPLSKIVLEHDAETLVLYPRLGKWTRILDTIEISDDDVKNIWKAKELGLIGRSPATDCARDCPHTRLEPQLPEAELEEIARPLPLIFAKGSLDREVDYDLAYAESYVRRTAPSLMTMLWRLDQSPSKKQIGVTRRMQDTLQESLGLDEATATKLVEYFRGDRSRTRTWIDPEEIAREMANEIEPWEKLLPKCVLRGLWSTAQGRARRVYTLPSKSSTVVKKTWDQWIT